MQAQMASDEHDPMYELILECNTATADVDEEMNRVHRFAADLYSVKFPELESLVPHLVDYCRTVLAIGNETDLSIIDLSGILNAATVMVVSVTGSSTTGIRLSESALRDCMDACEEVLQLDRDKKLLLSFVESRMLDLLPNAAAIVGIVL